MKRRKEISPNKWGIFALGMLVFMIVGIALLTIITDPYFHYHAPVKGISYRLYEQRYMNDGISRHFKYDTVITGNSLSENFKTTKTDELFGGSSIKLSYSGAGFHELWSSLDRTLSYNPSVKRVFMIMDCGDINKEKDYTRYTDYPEYLYDDILWNDAAYLWNKDILYRGTLYNLLMTLFGIPSTTFDEYSAKEGETGAREVLNYVQDIPNEEDIVLREYETEYKEMVSENIEGNILPVLRKYPDTEFYIVFAPASIAKWCDYYSRGQIDSRISGMEETARILLQEDNLRLYSFQNDFALTVDLDNYRDTIHYTSEVTSYMLEAIKAGDYRLTSDNYQEYMKELRDFYGTFDYRAWKSAEEQKINEK